MEDGYIARDGGREEEAFGKRGSFGVLGKGFWGWGGVFLASRGRRRRSGAKWGAPKGEGTSRTLDCHLISISSSFSTKLCCVRSLRCSVRELQLLLSPSTRLPSETPNTSMATDASDRPLLLDLTLSMSVGTRRPSPSEEFQSCAKSLQVLRQQTAEQIRLAAAENAYAERMREVTRMEMELAEEEFARARLVWERTREEVTKVERMKEMATRRINSACLEITCHSCHQRFRP
ncbi:hypothetical protein BHE74_00030219 [Ensete ventricosum]|nr:hypothetical protein BHE74_00030219 [Ensete ventricosum]RZS07649.1 hypothetical protein BHM03_00038552 [Ensete ventricosum]